MKTISAKHLNPIKKALLCLLILTLLFTFLPAPAQAAQKKNLKAMKIELAYKSAEYTGKPLKPKVSVQNGGKLLKKNRDYTVSYRNNKKIGKAAVVIKGKGRYKGTIKKFFKIRPKATALTAVSATGNSLIVKWKKRGTALIGYQLQYSPDKTFQSGAKTVLLADPSISKWEITGLKTDQTYYVRVRTFKEVKGKKYYSSWSKKVSAVTSSLYDESILQLAQVNADIACRVLKDRTQNEGVKNSLFSPFSLYEDLAMATNGASSSTLEELEAFLGNDIASVNEQIFNYNNRLPESIQVANSIWINERYGALDPVFQSDTEALYDAKIAAVPYNMDTVDAINSWVKEHTKEMIPSLLNELSDDEVMHLINAVAFESEWKKPYEQADIRDNEKFRLQNGKIQSCVMLNSKEQEYMDLTDADGNTIAYGFLKPYKDDSTAFLGLLPEEGYSVEDVLNFLDGTSYAVMYNGKRPYINGSLYAGIPEFAFDDELDLVPYLQNAGIHNAFSDQAEFDRMMADGLELHIDSVQQKTHIEVDRYGTKAAAVTDIGMKANSAFSARKDLYLILNRPFVYAIVDYQSGLPYFMGVECNPSGK